MNIFQSAFAVSAIIFTATPSLAAVHQLDYTFDPQVVADGNVISIDYDPALEVYVGSSIAGSVRFLDGQSLQFTAGDDQTIDFRFIGNKLSGGSLFFGYSITLVGIDGQFDGTATQSQTGILNNSEVYATWSQDGTATPFSITGFDYVISIAASGFVARELAFKATDVTVVGQPIPGGVPEPATWAMLIGGFGLVGAALRRRTPFATVRA